MASLRPILRGASAPQRMFVIPEQIATTSSSSTASTRSAYNISRSIVTSSTVRQQPQQSPRYSRVPQQTTTVSMSNPGRIQHPRQLSTTLRSQDQQQQPQNTEEDLSSSIPPSKIYTFEEIQSLTESSSSSHTPQNVIIIDVREPSEILGTGKIPTARNIPISSAPDSFFLGEEEFEDRFGFAKPSGEDEVVFYCKAGVRSKAAARLAGQAGFGGKGKIGEFPGSWVEWFAKGGRVERE